MWDAEFEIRKVIRVGNIVSYHNKHYIVIDIGIACGGNTMILSMVRINSKFPLRLRWVKELYDKEIEECWIVR